MENIRGSKINTMYASTPNFIDSLGKNKVMETGKPDLQQTNGKIYLNPFFLDRVPNQSQKSYLDLGF